MKLQLTLNFLEQGQAFVQKTFFCILLVWTHLFLTTLPHAYAPAASDHLVDDLCLLPKGELCCPENINILKTTIGHIQVI